MQRGCGRLGLLLAATRADPASARLGRRRALDRDPVQADPGALARDSEVDGLWQACAVEGDILPRSGQVRFGWAPEWTDAFLDAGQSCSVEAFAADPAPGIRKVCECSTDARTEEGRVRIKHELGVSWKRCGSEGQQCDCGQGAVRFGSGQRWFTSAAQAGATRCAAASFSGFDPRVGEAKECWCEEPPRGAPARARVAVVMLSRRPPELGQWLRYHVRYMGLDRVFMQVEDTPEFNTTFFALDEKIQEHVTVWRSAVSQVGDKRPRDDYETLQARQGQTMARALAASRELGIDWLLHIDDDELLYTPLHRPLGEVLAAMPAGFDQAFLPNAEAVYPSADVKDCFAETTRINVNAFTFASYANGKAAVRVGAADVRPAGPHMWRGGEGQQLPSIHLDREPFGAPLMLVHFESCPYARWKDKFWELGNTSPGKIASIPFPFYRASIERMQRCGRSSEAALQDEECSEGRLRQFWASWKTTAAARLKEQDLAPLRIPWESIEPAAAVA